jgi:uncharacterized membrane protein
MNEIVSFFLLLAFFYGILNLIVLVFLIFVMYMILRSKKGGEDGVFVKNKNTVEDCFKEN